MKNSAEKIKSRFLTVLAIYLAILIILQLIGIAYILHEPSLHRGIPLAIFLGTILPILLALIFMRFVKIA
ncbi:MAG: hypothetical protein DRN59_03815 [Thaumarchaeota archaeon]|nr:MAG: hypothetical protein DRN59_03815 [Nitrososphaerota archaeon]